jgi:DNA-binding GntR family transcriptional regulator
MMRTIEDVLSRLRAEFLEMPGMQLTADQVHRLCGVERALCRRALDALVASRFLRVKADGRYARVADAGDVPLPFLARADLRVERRTARAS